ncbi:MAG: hypothetical protein JWO74_3575 [Solirubrobacterales bacterium]|nr:hypothetical protein [Solirubrobacterales bacterium]
MARLPVLRRRRSKAEQALDVIQKAAKTYTSLKIAKAGPKAGARATAKAVKLAAVPAVVAGSVAVWRKRRAGNAEPSHDFDRPLGPVAAAGTVSPPAPVADTALSDAQAGAG